MLALGVEPGACSDDVILRQDYVAVALAGKGFLEFCYPSFSSSASDTAIELELNRLSPGG